VRRGGADHVTEGKGAEDAIGCREEELKAAQHCVCAEPEPTVAAALGHPEEAKQHLDDQQRTGGEANHLEVGARRGYMERCHLWA
jgi:hypothetical protein